MEALEMSDQARVQQLHKHLSRKVGRNVSDSEHIEDRWKALDMEQRAAYVKAASHNGPVLQERKAPPGEPSMEAAAACVPEWNLRELTNPDSAEHLMMLLRYRGGRDLYTQYRHHMWEPFADGQPDFEFIQRAMSQEGLRYDDALDGETERDGHFCFAHGDLYGMYVPPESDFTPGVQLFLGTGNVVPRDVGKLVLTRQMYFLERLNNIVDDLLAGSPQERSGPAAGNLVLHATPEEEEPVAVDAVDEPAADVEMSDHCAELDLLPLVLDRKASLDAYLAVLTSDREMLARDAFAWFSSRPELLREWKGSKYPSLDGYKPKVASRHMNAAVLDTVHNAVKSAATWTYVAELLRRAESEEGADAVYRSILLQELSNVVHGEFFRAQSALQRHLSESQGEYFRRDPCELDAAGNPRVKLSANAEELSDSEPLIYYMLKLCNKNATAATAARWLASIDDHLAEEPIDRRLIGRSEMGAVAEMSAVLWCIEDLNEKASLPPPSSERCQLFVSGSLQLDIEMNGIKKDLDLGEYVFPVERFSQPGMIEGALDALDKFVVEKTGTKLGFLYQDLVDECLSYLQRQYHASKTTPGKDWTPLPLPAREPLGKLVEQRKEKHRARSSSSSDYEIAPSLHGDSDAVPPAVAEAFKVSPATTKVFEALFGEHKAAGSRAVSWEAFNKAMAEWKFATMRGDGDLAVAFCRPVETGEVQRPLMVYRPYHDEFRGPESAILARRFRAAYLR